MINFKYPDKITVSGNNPLRGSAIIPGDKVTAVHLILATLIFDGKTTIKNLPLCGDVLKIINWIIANRYAKISLRQNTLTITPSDYCRREIDLTGLANTRNNICLISPAALKCQKVIFKGIGGCNFANRKIDLHLKLVETLKIKIVKKNNRCFITKDKLPPAIKFNCASKKYGPSVGATCHALMAGMALDREITLINPAQEPVAKTLAQYAAAAFNKKVVDDKKKLKIIPAKKTTPRKSVAITLPPDYTVAFTYISAAIISGGKIALKGVGNLPRSVISLLKKMNVSYAIGKNQIQIDADLNRISSPNKIICDTWPKFPSDMGPILAAAAAKCPQKTIIVDNIYDRRSSHVKGLNKMGYRLSADKNKVTVVGSGKKQFKKNFNVIVKARDIRSGAALLVGALGKNGKTTITNYRQISRGYSDIINSLNKMGADIKSNG